MSSTQLRPVPAGPAVPRQAAAGSESTEHNRLWRAGDPRVELSVVVPFYNPGPVLRRTVSTIVDTLRAEGIGFEVIAVSDGSTDGSETSLAGLGDEVRVVVNPVNQGKGAALHTGFGRARGAWCALIDADGDIDPAHLVHYLHIARTRRPAAVYADKRHPESSSGASAFRKLVSRVYSTLLTTLFLLGVRDTQTGCKLFRRDILAMLLPKMRERRFAFDLEFFIAAKAAGVRDLVPAPVRLNIREAGSTVTTKAIARTFRDTITIAGRTNFVKHYDPLTPTVTVRTMPAGGLTNPVPPAV
jgi:glycosyltransferase involved in cell wall biosynthesis